jgi:hypothetical protein
MLVNRKTVSRGDEVGSGTPSINYLTASFEWRFTVVTLVFLAASNSAVGQWMGKQTGCYADEIAANPNRPTVSNPGWSMDGITSGLKKAFARLLLVVC